MRRAVPKRAHAESPWLEIAGSLLLLAAAAPCVIWVAAKIFRAGAPFCDKPPKLSEILRWVRSS